MAYQILSVPATTPGADTNALVLFNSVDYKTAARGPVRFNDFLRYVLSLKNSQAGTLKAYASADAGATWAEIYEVAVAASTAQRNNIVAVPIEPHKDIRIDWVNGGVAQATWYVAQGLDDGQAPLRSVFSDAAGNPDPNSAASVVTSQLPATIGQKTKALSLSVVEASDAVQTKAASLRAYLRTEGLPITCGTVSKTFTVPAAWKGLHIRMQAEFSDVYYQISTAVGTPAVADKTARATETGTNPIALTAPASGNGVFRIPAGTFLDIPFPTNAETFALQANVDASVCRTHPAES